MSWWGDYRDGRKDVFVGTNGIMGKMVMVEKMVGTMMMVGKMVMIVGKMVVMGKKKRNLWAESRLHAGCQPRILIK